MGRSPLRAGGARCADAYGGGAVQRVVARVHGLQRADLDAGRIRRVLIEAACRNTVGFAAITATAQVHVQVAGRSIVVVTDTICGVLGAEEKPNRTGGSSGASPPRSTPRKVPSTAAMRLLRRTP